MGGLKEFFQQFEAVKERLNNDQLSIAEFWKQLGNPEKENWLEIIQEALDFDDIAIKSADLSASSAKEHAYIGKQNLPELAEYEPGQQYEIACESLENWQPYKDTLTKIGEAWNISLRGIVYPVEKKVVGDSGYLIYTPNILKELEQRYLLQNEDIRPYLREKNIEKLVTLVVNRTEIIDALSEIDRVELLTLTDGSSKQFLYQLVLKMNNANELEKLIDKVMALLPPTVFNQLISYQEKGKKTLLATVREIFPESSANSLKDKLTPKEANKEASHIKSEINTHQSSIHTSVDFSLIQVFKRFAENYKIEDVTIVLQPNNRKITIKNYDPLNNFTDQLLNGLIEKINRFLELTDDILLEELNQENGSLYESKDVETFKQNLEISLRFITSILKGDRFGSESHSLDPKSINTIGLSLQHIVAVTYWGLLSASNPESDAKNFLHYVKHLKEIMREYNETDHDPDQNKCQGGTINHFVKALDGIAPDVTVASVTKKDIQNETNELWHRYLIEKMKNDPALCKQVNHNLLQQDDLTNLIKAHFPNFLEYALPHLHKNYYHILLDEKIYAFFLENEENLISAITLGLTRDKTLMSEFEDYCNQTGLLKEMELSTYLAFLKEGKVPYYFHAKETGTVSFIEFIVTSKNISIETALVCFEELDESFQPILLNTFRRCFGEEALIQAFLDAQNIKLLKRIDPDLKKTETILEQMHSIDRINCYKETLLEYALRYLDLEFVCQLDGPNFEYIEKLPKNDDTDKLFKLSLEKGKSKLAIHFLRPENVNEPSKTVTHVKEIYYNPWFTDIEYVEEPIEYPIHRAIQLKDIELIQAIVQAGARLTNKDDSGRTPLILALELNLVAKAILPNKFLEESIQDAIYKKKYELIKKIDPDHTIILHLLKEKKLEIISTLFCDLIENGQEKLAKLIFENIDDKESLINPVVINEKIYHPLFSAIKAGNSELVKLLLDSNADVVVIKNIYYKFESAEKVLTRLPESKSKEDIARLFKDQNISKKKYEFFEKKKIYCFFDLKKEEHLEFIRGMTPTLNDLIKAISEEYLVLAEIFVASILEKNPGKFTDRQHDLLIDAFQSLIFHECRNISNKIDFVPFIENLIKLDLNINEDLIKRVFQFNIVGSIANKPLATAIIKNHDGCLNDLSLRTKLYHRLIVSDNVDAFRYLFLTFEDSQLLPSLNLNLENLGSHIAGFLFDSGYLKFEKENKYQISGCQSKLTSDEFVKKVTSGNNLKILESLLENDLNVKNFDDNNDETLLMRLVQMNSDHTDVFINIFKKILAKEKYDAPSSLFSPPKMSYINLKDNMGRSALYYAVERKNQLAIRLLLKHGAIPDERVKWFMKEELVGRVWR